MDSPIWKRSIFVFGLIVLIFRWHYAKCQPSGKSWTRSLIENSPTIAVVLLLPYSGMNLLILCTLWQFFAFIWSRDLYQKYPRIQKYLGLAWRELLKQSAHKSTWNFISMIKKIKILISTVISYLVCEQIL